MGERPTRSQTPDAGPDTDYRLEDYFKSGVSEVWSLETGAWSDERACGAAAGCVCGAWAWWMWSRISRASTSKRYQKGVTGLCDVHMC